MRFNKVVETIEKALPAIVSAGVIGLFTMTVQFWVLRSEVSYLRQDMQDLKATVGRLLERNIYYHGEEDVPTRIAQKETR